MDKRVDPNCSSSQVDNDPKDEQYKELLLKLEQQPNWDGLMFIKYDGFWFPEMFFRPVLSSKKHFKAKNNDIILSNMPKSGTTWLKALAFAIANRHVYPIDRSPLLASNPHELVPTLEVHLYREQENPDLEGLPSPRVMHTHMPFRILPNSIRESECRIIYICRNLLDQFMSERFFSLENKLGKDAAILELDEAVDKFCRGIHHYGPFWDHILGYWNAHLENPQKVLFLKYEGLKEDISSHVKKIAEFIECPFSPEEEKQGMVEEISRLCSFENLKNLETNKNGYILDGFLKKSTFFRKGEVGDGINHLTPAMVERIQKLKENKFHDSGLIFDTFAKPARE